MAFLKLFSKSSSKMLSLPSGSFTVDRDGRVLISTLPNSFPRKVIDEVGQDVLKTFRAAQQAQVPLSELVINFSSLKLTARELRGGAIIFLSPQTLSTQQI